MLDLNKFYEDFLDDLNLDIDFDVKTRQLIVKTAENSYIDVVELPTLTQLVNVKADEFFRAILVDLNTRIEVEIVNESEFNNGETDLDYTVEIHLRTKSNLVYMDLIREILDESELLVSKHEVYNIINFCEKNHYVKEKDSVSYERYDFVLKIESTDEMDNALKMLSNFLEPFKTVTGENISNDALPEKVIKQFKNFIKS